MHPLYPGRDVDPQKDLDPDNKVIPIGALSVASIIAAHNVPVKLIDCRYAAKRDIVQEIETLLPETTLVGFSVMTGQITHALQLTNLVKKNRPSLPVIWGGIHPTLFPEQTLVHPGIDYIINGECAENILQLVRFVIDHTGSLDAIPGLGYKQNGAVMLNPGAPPADVNTVPPLNYSLLDLENHAGRKLVNGSIVRGIDVLTSRGCPYRCTFCVNATLHHSKWRPIDIARVVEQIKALTTELKFNHIWFADDYLFANKRRVVEMLTMMRDSGIRVTWEANIRANNFGDKKIDDETLALMKESGCVSLNIGFESGSDRMLAFYKKDITVADILNSVDKCDKYGIYVKGFFIMGAPGETMEEIYATLNLNYRLLSNYDRYIPNAPGFYRPYPGGELYDYTVKNYPFPVPDSLEAWAEACASTGYLDPQRFPWISDFKKLTELRFYARLLNGFAKHVFNKARHAPLFVLMPLIKRRFKYNFWGIRVEAKLFYFFYNLLKKNYRLLKWLKIPLNM